ncbi:Gfo/Idh/MocA family protein [Planctomicrobium sp. SH664]|uniref:Gfo/Idh/MocA family protein n=1 Tax=Planctomicrobium sp. SH664 TaxID=3448125 RepID=UPI003F5B40C8
MAPLNRRDWMQTVVAAAAVLSAGATTRGAVSSEKLRVAVIGGRGNYGHGLDKVWLEIPQAEIVALADDNAEALAKAAGRLQVQQTFSDYRKMLDTVKPDVVSICPRWVDLHFDMGMACAERGIHMYLEKPFVPTLAEADQLIAACRKTNAKLAIACQTRYGSRVDAARQLIQEGRIGQVLEYRARGKEDHRGGAEDLWVLGTHVFDLIEFFGGCPQWCFGTLLEKGRPVLPQDIRDGAEGLGPLAGDQVQAMYGMPDNSTAYFASRRGNNTKGERFGLQIFGTEGIVEIMSGFQSSVQILADRNWSPGRSGKTWEVVEEAELTDIDPALAASLKNGNVVAVLDLLAAIREDRDPRCGPDDGRATLEMIHGVFESHRLQRPVTLPLENRRHALSLLAASKR